MSKNILELSGVTKSIVGVEVLSNVSFCLRDGEILSILGQSGCGKTTLLNTIAGLSDIDDGEIILQSQKVASRGFSTKIQDRNVGILFQDFALFPHLSVEENILFGLFSLGKTQKTQRLNEVLHMVGLEGFNKRYPHELSGGQAQRVAIARAIAPKPKLILLDEPFSSLNHTLSVHMRSEIKDIINKNNLSAIIVTHDKEDAFYLSDTIALMDKGKIIDINSPKELYINPKSFESAVFLGEANHIDDYQKIEDVNLREWIVSKKGIFRANELKMDNSAKNGFTARVLNTIFVGNYIEAEVDLGGFRAKLHLDCDPVVGSVIKLTPNNYQCQIS